MFSRRIVGWAILVYTLASWGGRIGLLTDVDGGNLWSWVRIGGSFVVGIVTWLSFVTNRWQRPMAFFFAGFTTLIWIRSLVVVWTEPANSLAFNMVHTGLAALWLVMAGLAVRVGQETGSGAREATSGVPGGTISASVDTTSSIDR